MWDRHIILLGIKFQTRWNKNFFGFAHAFLKNQNAWAESRFRLKIRIQHKISRRMIYFINELISKYPGFSWSYYLRGRGTLNIENVGKTNINTIFTHIFRREILRWIGIFSRNFDSAHAFWWKVAFKTLRRRITPLFSFVHPGILCAGSYYLYPSDKYRFRRVPSCSGYVLPKKLILAGSAFTLAPSNG